MPATLTACVRRLRSSVRRWKLDFPVNRVTAARAARVLHPRTGGRVGEILALYDETMRRDPAPAAEVRYERVGGVVRSVGLWNVVLAWDLSDLGAAAAAVAEQAAYGRGAGLQLEWELVDHDSPAGLWGAIGVGGGRS